MCARRSILCAPKLPADTDEPTVNEVNLSLFPILVITLSGDVPERNPDAPGAPTCRIPLRPSRRFLEAKIGGDRDELVEIIFEPGLLESYSRRSRRIARIGSHDPTS